MISIVDGISGLATRLDEGFVDERVLFGLIIWTIHKSGLHWYFAASSV